MRGLISSRNVTALIRLFPSKKLSGQADSVILSSAILQEHAQDVSGPHHSEPQSLFMKATPPFLGHGEDPSAMTWHSFRLSALTQSRGRKKRRRSALGPSGSCIRHEHFQNDSSTNTSPSLSRTPNTPSIEDARALGKTEEGSSLKNFLWVFSYFKRDEILDFSTSCSRAVEWTMDTIVVIVEANKTPIDWLTFVAEIKVRQRSGFQSL